jgi:hypothetical protein
MTLGYADMRECILKRQQLFRTRSRYYDAAVAGCCASARLNIRGVRSRRKVEILRGSKSRRRSLTNTTTGSDRIVPPGQQPPAQGLSSRLARFARSAITHWQFSIVLLAGIVVRVIVMIGYPPIMWFNDSYNYV